MNLGKVFNKALGVCVAALAFASGVAHALILDNGANNPLNFAWSFDTGTAAGVLTGNGSISASGFNSNSLILFISLNNTSALATNRLTSFGFGIDPNATGSSFVDANDGGMVDAILGGTLFLNSIEVCVFGGNNCGDGTTGGINGNASDSFAVVLSGTWSNAVNIDPIGLKYQTDSGAFAFCASGTNNCTPPTSQVPEPASMTLLALGLLGLGCTRRKLTS